MPMLAKAVVVNGHYMNITSNGTFSTGIQNILSYCKEYTSQILFSFSLHYNELQQKKLLDKFVSNVNLVKKFGASYIITLVLNKQYYKKIDEIKKFTITNFNHLPAVFIGRIGTTSKIDCVNNNIHEFIQYGKSFSSQLFSFCIRHFANLNERRCNAGKYTFILDIQTGLCKPCYHINSNTFNIFDNTQSIHYANNSIKCKQNCVNNAHFIALGSCPNEEKQFTYYSIRKDNGIFSSNMKEFLDQKLPIN